MSSDTPLGHTETRCARPVNLSLIGVILYQLDSSGPSSVKTHENHWKSEISFTACEEESKVCMARSVRHGLSWQSPSAHHGGDFLNSSQVGFSTFATELEPPRGVGQSTCYELPAIDQHKHERKTRSTSVCPHVGIHEYH